MTTMLGATLKAPVQSKSHWQPKRLLRLFRASPSALIGIPILLIVMAAAIFAPVISPQDPLKQNLSLRLQPPVWYVEGSAEYPLGTDHLGRDLLSRIIYGARVSLIVGLTAVGMASVLGVLIGLTIGFVRGRLDDVVMAVADVQMAFPFFLLILVVAFLLGPNLRNAVITLGVTGWVIFARLTRGEVLSVRERDFVLSARAVGSPSFRIIFQHILPQVVTPIIVVATLQIGRVIVAEASLSFLGMGIQPPTPSWGNMLAQGRDYLLVAWWIATFPGLAIAITVLGFNMVGDWLRDLLDPQSHLRNRGDL